MQTTIIKMKTGEVLEGTLWSFRPEEGWFSLYMPEEDKIIQLADVESAITKNDRIGVNKIGDYDILERAKKLGWKD